METGQSPTEKLAEENAILKSKLNRLMASTDGLKESETRVHDLEQQLKQQGRDIVDLSSQLNVSKLYIDELDETATMQGRSFASFMESIGPTSHRAPAKPAHSPIPESPEIPSGPVVASPSPQPDLGHMNGLPDNTFSDPSSRVTDATHDTHMTSDTASSPEQAHGGPSFAIPEVPLDRMSGNRTPTPHPPPDPTNIGMTTDSMTVTGDAPDSPVLETSFPPGPAPDPYMSVSESDTEFGDEEAAVEDTFSDGMTLITAQRIAGLEAQRDKLTFQMRELDTQLTDSQYALRNAELDAQQAKSRMESAVERSDRLRRMYLESETKVDDLQNRVMELELTVKSQRSEISGLKQNLRFATTQVEEQTPKLTRLEQDVDATQVRLTTMTKAHRALERKAGTMQTELDLARMELGEKETLIEQLYGLVERERAESLAIQRDRDDNDGIRRARAADELTSHLGGLIRDIDRLRDDLEVGVD